MFSKTDYLTEEEKELVINEINERLRDMVFSQGKKRLSKELVEILGLPIMDEDSGSTLDVSFVVNFVIGDIQQIVSRSRRDKVPV
ncbi:MAG: hypothetical protein H3Z50_07725 [archaeon]|nr:hypothetical protein [archaeon]